MAGLAARAPNQQDATEASARELRKPVVKEYDPHGDSHCSSQQWYTLVRLHDYGSAGHVASDEELRELEERILSEPDTSDDDALETLLMNMFYSGRIQSMPAIYRTNDDRFDVIRPLIECAESEIAEYAQLKEFPILPCNLCGSQDGLKRVEMKKLLTELELKNPGIRDVMLASMKHVRPSHLLDLELNDRLNGVGTVSKLEGADPLSELEAPRPQLINIEG